MPPWIDSPGDQSVGAWDTGAGDVSAGSAGGGVHITAAVIILLAILLKAFTESNLISTDLAEVRVSLLNIFAVVLMYAAGKIGFLAVTGFMSARGLALPGQVELGQIL
jgi:Ca2+/Na+ antiporter